HDHNREFLVVVDARHYVVGQQHVLVEQVPDCQIFRVIADCHGGYDFLAVEENRQRALDGDRRLDARPGLIDAGDPLGQPWIERIGPDDVTVAVFAHAVTIADILAQHENCPSLSGQRCLFCPCLMRCIDEDGFQAAHDRHKLAANEKATPGRCLSCFALPKTSCCRPRSPARCRGRAGTHKISARAASSMQWSTTNSESNMSTLSRCICTSRKLPGSTSSPTVTRISIPTSAARAGPTIPRGTWAGSIATRSQSPPVRAASDFRPATFCTITLSHA